MEILEKLEQESFEAACEILDIAKIKKGQLFVVGCSTSEVMFKEPVAVEHIRAHAGMDIGDTLIGMHLKDVAVPVRISRKVIGEAHVVCARTRAKFIGGSRAIYAEDKL